MVAKVAEIDGKADKVGFSINFCHFGQYPYVYTGLLIHCFTTNTRVHGYTVLGYFSLNSRRSLVSEAAPPLRGGAAALTSCTPLAWSWVYPCTGTVHGYRQQ